MIWGITFKNAESFNDKISLKYFMYLNGFLLEKFRYDQVLPIKIYGEELSKYSSRIVEWQPDPGYEARYVHRFTSIEFHA
jgi:hypothetical protein